MPDDVVISLPAELDEKLSRLASERGKSKSQLVCEALAEFILSEEAFASAVAEGRAAVDAGDVIDHDEVRQAVDALLARKK